MQTMLVAITSPLQGFSNILRVAYIVCRDLPCSVEYEESANPNNGLIRISHAAEPNYVERFLPSLEKQFAKEATAEGLDGLKGHRSVGGIRASIYNAFPREGVEKLVDFMHDFKRKNG